MTRSRRTVRLRSSGALRRTTAAGLMGVAVAAIAAAAALAASPTGTVTETINVGVRSLTVSPTSVTMCTTASPLTFPNGVCDSPTITITNGPAGGHVDVNGTTAVPSDGSGNGWALCGTQGSNCTGSTQFEVPGVNQYEENTGPANGGLTGTFMSTTPACDTAFDSGGTGCVSSPGQIATETVEIDGPSSSSDQSPTFSTTATWTAAP